MPVESPDGVHISDTSQSMLAWQTFFAVTVVPYRDCGSLPVHSFRGTQTAPMTVFPGTRQQA
jgi:hypothetical protein